MNPTKNSPAAWPTVTIAVGDIDRSPLNPRTEWCELPQLGESLLRGQVQPLILRPSPVSAGRYELVDGERRWRAAQVAGIKHLLARVGEIDDAEVFRIIFATGGEAGAAPLRPLELAAGLAAARERLGLAVPELARRFELSERYVLRLLVLLRLPDEMKAAVAAGTVGLPVAERVARLPDAVRAEVAARVLTAGVAGGAMTAGEAEAYLENEVFRDLGAARFDVESADLVPATGACVRRTRSGAWESECPHWAGNAGERTSRPHRCMNPECFAAKTAAARAALLARHTGPGRRALAEEENAAAFPRGEMGLSYRSEFVALNEPVPRDLLKPDVGRAPKWAEILKEGAGGEGLAVEVRVGVDQAGRVVDLIDRELAVAAVKEEEAEILAPRVARAAGVRAGASVRDEEKRDRELGEKQAKARKRRESAAEAWIAERMRVIVEGGVLGLAGESLWRALAHDAVAALGEAESRWLAQRLGERGEEAPTELAQRIDALTAPAAAAVAMAALATPRLLADGPTGTWARRWEQLGAEGGAA
jgi:ParB/RepB/Spo0J family partition protein